MLYLLRWKQAQVKRLGQILLGPGFTEEETLELGLLELLTHPQEMPFSGGSRKGHQDGGSEE